MTTLQIRVDDTLKQDADALFSSLGLDTTTAVRMFLNAAVEYEGIPFPIQHRTLPPALNKAVLDSRYRRNLHGPFDTAEEAVRSMLEE